MTMNRRTRMPVSEGLYYILTGLFQPEWVYFCCLVRQGVEEVSEDACRYLECVLCHPSQDIVRIHSLE